ncbi:sigma factor-like helix-turn-helix DNA-binding protein [Peribacillus butanolivorans]|uniref:sigma factor-like helix-turn-helix DNA-binding protein n=1 Tax=Peribacillus butanolivorans TaxID=421767 RepID=UPI0037CBE422
MRVKELIGNAGLFGGTQQVEIYFPEGSPDRVEPQATVSVEETILKLDEDQMLSHTVMNLPIKYREVIYLFYFQELSIKEISEMTGINQGTIKTRMRRAAMLKEKLEGYNDYFILNTAGH